MLGGSTNHFGNLDSFANWNVDSGKYSHPVIAEAKVAAATPISKYLMMSCINPVRIVAAYPIHSPFAKNGVVGSGRFKRPDPHQEGRY